ncbi:MAG: sugar phosphate isomerase/epimerase [Clostridia bacterium]|nr:sugar phosphate isomerase/epimerase [Clostridia bacterium]
MKYALQLYSVRDGIRNGDDLLKALEKVKEIGYEGVEFAGTQGLSADVLKAKLDELGLVCVGTHIGVDDFAPDKRAATLSFYKTLGCKYIGVGGGDTGSEKSLAHVLDVMGSANDEFEKEGVKVYFHNHTGEFKPTKDSPDGKLIIDRLAERMWLEIDTYWSFHAGVDNKTFLRDMKDHICLIHLKDGNDGTPCALGEGQNDIPAIIDASKDIGVEWIIVENDDPVPDGISDVTRSMAYLKKIV